MENTTLLPFDLLLPCMRAPFMFAREFARRLWLMEAIQMISDGLAMASGTLMPRGGALTAEGQAAGFSIGRAPLTTEALKEHC